MCVQLSAVQYLFTCTIQRTCYSWRRFSWPSLQCQGLSNLLHGSSPGFFDRLFFLKLETVLLWLYGHAHEFCRFSHWTCASSLFAFIVFVFDASRLFMSQFLQIKFFSDLASDYILYMHYSILSYSRTKSFVAIAIHNLLTTVNGIFLMFGFQQGNFRRKLTSCLQDCIA